MHCQLEELNGLLLQAHFDNAEFHTAAILPMQYEINVVDTSAITAAAVTLRFFKM